MENGRQSHNHTGTPPVYSDLEHTERQAGQVAEPCNGRVVTALAAPLSSEEHTEEVRDIGSRLDRRVLRGRRVAPEQPRALGKDQFWAGRDAGRELLLAKL